MLAYSFFFLLTAFISYGTASYVLEDDYSGDSFFSKFDFFTGGDPTHGFVNYVDSGTAQSSGLISNSNGAIYMGVDHTNKATSAGRSSVRLTSKNSYTHGLIILDLSHMPGGICGTWPAFWTVGPGWPSAGEIDIIEGVNSQSANAMTLHTGSGCSISGSGSSFTGHMTTPNCDVNAAGQSTNAGCQIASSQSSTYGTGFNAQQGGVYATEWTSDAINIWFFPRGSTPQDISSGSPNPSGWGTPAAAFAGGSGCNIDSHFKNHQIVFDTTFCGDWAANVWSTDSTCSAKASTCQDFVQNNPSAFADAYWSVNSLKVYQNNGASSGGSSVPSIASTPPAISQPTGAPQSVSVPIPSPPLSIPTGFSAPGAAPTFNTNAFSRGRGRPTQAPQFGRQRTQVAAFSATTGVAKGVQTQTTSTVANQNVIDAVGINATTTSSSAPTPSSNKGINTSLTNTTVPAASNINSNQTRFSNTTYNSPLPNTIQTFSSNNSPSPSSTAVAISTTTTTTTPTATSTYLLIPTPSSSSSSPTNDNNMLIQADGKGEVSESPENQIQFQSQPQPEHQSPCKPSKKSKRKNKKHKHKRDKKQKKTHHHHHKSAEQVIEEEALELKPRHLHSHWQRKNIHSNRYRSLIQKEKNNPSRS